MITAFVPTLNSSRTLGATLKSINSQTVKPERVIVIDSGSTDDTEKIAKEYGAEFYSPEFFGFDFLGLSRARNRILELAQTPYLLSVDSDVMIENDYIENFLPVIEKKKLGGIGGKLIDILRTRPADRYRAMVLMKDLLEPYSRGICEKTEWLNGSQSIYSISALKEVGKKVSGSEYRPFNEKLATNFEDVDIGQKLTSAGFNLEYNTAKAGLHLQQDDLYSLIDRKYRYRIFKWELAGAFDSPEIYAKRSEHNKNIVTFTLQTIHSKNRKYLSYPSILFGYVTFLRDIPYFVNHGNPEYAAAIYSSYEKSLDDFKDEKLKSRILSDIKATVPDMEPLWGKADADLYGWFKKLAESDFENYSTQGITDSIDYFDNFEQKSDVLVSFGREKIENSEKFVINYEIDMYNPDEVYYELLGLKPASVEFSGSNRAVQEKLSKLTEDYFWKY